MSETKQLISAFAGVILIGLAGFFGADLIHYSGDLVIENYEATLSPEGFLTEKYVYDVGSSNKYTMLFREWKIPLINPDEDNPAHLHIKVTNISCAMDSIPYIKDYVGKVWTPDDMARRTASEKAFRNEVGCYSPKFYDVGEYTISYAYQVNPPVECDDNLCHMNFKFADEHIPYRNVKIVLKDPDNYIVKVFPHPPDFKTSISDGGWIISGKSPKNGLVEVEMLLKPGLSGGFVARLDNIEEKTVNANSPYSNNYFLLSGLKYILIAVVLGFPLILYFIYIRYGTEKEFTVPEYLSFVPSKKKPWLVNMLFKRDAFDFDEDGFFATLLDLHKRDFLKIEPSTEIKQIIKVSKNNKRNVKVRLLKKPEDTDDRYEKSLLSLLNNWSKDGFFDTEYFIKAVKSMKNKESEIRKLKSQMDFLTCKAIPMLAKDYVVRGGKRITVLLAVSILLVIVFFLLRSSKYPVFEENIIYSAIIALQSAFILIFTRSTLFGRWKGEYYKEKLEWDSFRNFLSDMAMIKKYAPEDIVIWKDWLIYGTALGVGEKVVEAMNAMNVNIPEVDFAPHVYTSFHSSSATVTSTYSAATGGSGGGFGGGGGSGGGGAGGR